MADVYIIVEGHGEQGFLDECVIPHLWSRGVYGRAILEGGVRAWPTVRREITDFLKEGKRGRPIYVSTMFDYFRLPMDWPGRRDAASKPIPERAIHVERQIALEVAAHLGDAFRPELLFPYIQMHELEALVLAEPLNLSAEFPGQDKAIGDLADSIAGMLPEEINDDPINAPSKRIIRFLPEYERRKAQAAVNVLSITGLAVLRDRCPHFNQWISQLEALGA